MVSNEKADQRLQGRRYYWNGRIDMQSNTYFIWSLVLAAVTVIVVGSLIIGFS